MYTSFSTTSFNQHGKRKFDEEEEVEDLIDEDSELDKSNRQEAAQDDAQQQARIKARATSDFIQVFLPM